MEKPNKNSVTLIEMILAMALLITIILSATSLDIASRYFFNSSELKAKTLNEAALVAGHIAKNSFFSLGEAGMDTSGDDGDIGRRGFSVSSQGTTLMIRQDLQSSNNYYSSLDSPQLISDDMCIKYVFDAAAHTVTYYKYASNNCSGTPLQTIVLTHKLVSLSSGRYLSYNSANPFRLSLHVKLRSYPYKDADPLTNPEQELRTAVFIH